MVMASALPFASATFWSASNLICSSLFLAARACCSAVTFASIASLKIFENSKNKPNQELGATCEADRIKNLSHGGPPRKGYTTLAAGEGGNLKS